MTDEGCAGGIVGEHERRMLDWHGLRPSRAQTCLRVVLGKRCVDGWYRRCLCRTVQRGPLFDHVKIWLDQGGRHVLTTEPYGITRQTLAELIEQTSHLGIAMTISDRSPWYPRFTALLLLTAVRIPTGVVQCEECGAVVPYGVADESWHCPGCSKC